MRKSQWNIERNMTTQKSIQVVSQTLYYGIVVKWIFNHPVFCTAIYMNVSLLLVGGLNMTGLMLNDDERYVSHLLLITGIVTREIRRVQHVEQVLFNLPEYLRSLSVFFY